MNDPISKVNLRLPTEVMDLAKQEAVATGLSLNAYIGQAIRSYLRHTQRQRKALDGRGEPEGKRSLTARPAALPAPQSPLHQQVTGAKVGRNDPCPCGSGRKAKQCHPAMC